MLKEILRTKKINDCDTLEESNSQAMKYLNNDIEELDAVMSKLKNVMLSDLAKENPELRNEMFDSLSELSSVRHGLKALIDILQ